VSQRKKYHLRAKPNKKARNRRWHIWWWEDGRQKFHPESFERKGVAEDLIERWLRRERMRGGTVTFQSFAADFFTDQERCPYLARHRNLSESTVYVHKNNLERIIEQFGDRRIDQITDYEFEQWLLHLRRKPKKKGRKPSDMPELSGRSKNSILETYRIIMREARKARLIESLPEIDRLENQYRSRGILSEEEVSTLFPEEEVALHERWSLQEKDHSGYTFGLMAKVQLHGGMRPGEVRALQPFQVYPEQNTLFLIHQFDGEGRLAPLKKSTSSEKRKRFVRIPTATKEQLWRWIKTNGIDRDYYLRRFKKVLEKNGIEPGERWLVPYSLRYTFRSRIHGHIDLETIMQLMGHRSEEMSEHYNQVNPEQFKVFGQYQRKIDELWY
jgi:integrase